jgi:hypothetical protein
MTACFMTNDPVGHRKRPPPIVGDHDRRDAQLALKAADLAAELLAHFRVERRQRLVEQQDIGRERQGPASAVRCCWPPDSWRGYFSICSPRPTRLTMSDTILSTPFFPPCVFRFRPYSMFCRTLILGKSA